MCGQVVSEKKTYGLIKIRIQEAQLEEPRNYHAVVSIGAQVDLPCMMCVACTKKPKCKSKSKYISPAKVLRVCAT